MSAADLHTPLTLPPPHAEPVRASATVLLVEDDRAIRRYLQVILERAGFRVIAAADGLEAMKVVLSEPVEAVVTDAIMPHLGGRELCRFLRRHPKLKCLPVVLLSGSEPSGQTTEPAESPDRYLTKPVRPEELTSCIATLLDRPA
jgi:CheY-like chemotaxis protein